MKDTRLVGEWVTVARLQSTGKQWELVRVVESKYGGDQLPLGFYGKKQAFLYIMEKKI